MATAPYPNLETVFYQQYEITKRDEVVGVLLALFLGGFGAHHFYLRRTGLGVLYLLFSWTGITWIFGFIECFFMPGRVRMYNAVQAAGLAAALGIGVPAWAGSPGWGEPGYGPAPVYISVQPPALGVPVVEASIFPCANCGNGNPAGARFCSSCGNRLL